MTFAERLRQILAGFEEKKEDFSTHDVSEAMRPLVREVREAQKELPADLRGEAMAFEFMENYPEDKNNWGTYHGPMMVWQDAQGQWFEIPSLSDVTADDLTYWAKRAREVSHPLLAIRYADLVWDLSQKVTGKGAGVDLARIVVDATIALARSGSHEPIYTKEKLARALSVALSIRDAERVRAARDVIIAYEDQVAEDGLRGLWGFAFDLLLDNPKVPLDPGQAAAIVAALEARAGRLMGPPPDPHGVEAAALRLAGYYNRTGNTEDRNRILGIYADAFSEAARTAAPLVGTVWLQKVYEILRANGMRERASAIEKQLRDISPRAVDDMKTVSWEFKITEEEMTRYLDELTKGELPQALGRIAMHFVPRREAIEKQVKDLAEKAPLQAMIPKVIFDHQRAVATVGSVQDDLEGNVVSQIAQNIQIESVFLRAALSRLERDGKLTTASLAEMLEASPVFTADSRTLVEAGLGAYTRGDYIASCSILVPQIEGALRTLLALAGGGIYRQGRNGLVVLRTLDDILRDSVLAQALGSDVTEYFRVVLTDQRGLNLRNAICHGFAPPGTFSQSVADRILHLVIVLSQLRDGGSDAAAGS